MLIKLFLQKYLYTCGLSLKSYLVLLVRNWKLHLQDVQHPHITQVLQAAEHQKLVQYVINKLHCKNLEQMNKIKTNGLKCVSLPSCKSDVYELRGGRLAGFSLLVFHHLHLTENIFKKGLLVIKSDLQHISKPTIQHRHSMAA